MSDYRSVLQELSRKLRREEASLENARRQLDEIQAQIERTKTTIAGIEELQGSPAARRVLFGFGTGVGSEATAVAAHEAKPYRGLTIMEAARKYLEESGPAPAPAIANALKAGGIRSDSKKFRNTVYSILFRASQDGGGIEKIGRDFRIARPSKAENGTPALPTVPLQPS